MRGNLFRPKILPETFEHIARAILHVRSCGQLDASNMLSVSNWMNEDMMEGLTPKLLEGRPNTYTYTKALAENLVEEYSAQVPVAIVRPSIITGAFPISFEICGKV